jgi:hypothetical protein
MPRLQSGRVVGVMLVEMRDSLELDTSGPVWRGRLNIRPDYNTVDDLAGYMRVLYVPPGGTPEEDAYDSGYNLYQVCAGLAGWTAAEIEEFQAWIAANQPLQEELCRQCEAAKLEDISRDTWQDDEE